MHCCKAALSVALLLTTCLTGKAGAETTDARADAAQELFDRGRDLVKAGRAAEACPLFEKSQELDPGLGTEFNLADCHERLGRLASAHGLFTRVADRAQATAQEKRARVARERASALVPRLSKLVIVVPSSELSGLRIERDGTELPPTEWNMPVPVDPGAHHVRAWGPGIGQWTTEVSVTTEGAVHEVTIPASQKLSFLEPLHRKLGLAAAGVGVVGVSVGTFFGLRAIDKRNDANRAGCNGSSCDDAESARLREQARSAGNSATLAMSIGAAGLATGAVLIWVVSDSDAEGPDSEDRSAAIELHPAFAASGGRLLLRGEF